jgi:hypothetical protein
MMKRSSNGQAASDRQTGSGDELMPAFRSRARIISNSPTWVNRRELTLFAVLRALPPVSKAVGS